MWLSFKGRKHQQHTNYVRCHPGGRNTYEITENSRVRPSLEKVTRPPRLVLCRFIAHKRVRRLKENPMGHIAQDIQISLTSVLINRLKISRLIRSQDVIFVAFCGICLWMEIHEEVSARLGQPYGANLIFRYLGDRVKGRNGQHIGRGIGIMERDKYGSFNSHIGYPGPGLNLSSP